MDVHADQDTFDVIMTLAVTSRALPSLGKVTIADDAALTWYWPYPPASGAASVADKAADAFLQLMLPWPGQDAASDEDRRYTTLTGLGARNQSETVTCQVAHSPAGPS